MNVQDPPNEATWSAKGLLLFRKGTVDVPADVSSLGDAGDHPALAL